MLKYLSIYENLKKDIIEGKIKVGERFPAEPELVKKFNASRITVRHSVQMLVDEGYLEKLSGIGTIVISDKGSLQLKSLMSFSEENKNRNIESIITDFSMNIEASLYVSSQLKLPKDKKIHYQEKIRKIDSLTVGFQRVYIPNSIELNENEISDPNLSLYNLFNQKGHSVKSATETIESILSDNKLSKYLEVKLNSPLLLVRRTTRDKFSRVIEYAEIYYRADRYKYQLELEI